jgi:hypothetical protein
MSGVRSVIVYIAIVTDTTVVSGSGSARLVLQSMPSLRDCARIAHLNRSIFATVKTMKPIHSYEALKALKPI